MKLLVERKGRVAEVLGVYIPLTDLRDMVAAFEGEEWNSKSAYNAFEDLRSMYKEAT